MISLDTKNFQREPKAIYFTAFCFLTKMKNIELL